jgi:hypothetical protein
VSSIHADLPKNGNLDLSLKVQISEEEPMDSLLALGIQTRAVKFSFKDCWRIASNIAGFTTDHGTVTDWEVIEASPLVRALLNDGLSRAFRMTHHKFSFSTGSTLEILAESVFIDTGSGP